MLNEFAHGKDKTVLKGPNLKAKANAALAIGKLIQIADNKSFSVDYENKHGDKAKFGWYRYDTRLALPVYNSLFFPLLDTFRFLLKTCWSMITK